MPESFRERYRRERIPKYYSGLVHAAFAISVLVGGMLYAFFQLESVASLEWIAIPATLLFGNFFEYLFHRYLLHRLVPGFKPIFVIHTLEHHQFFTPERPSFESSRDFHTVFFPVWAPVFAVTVFWLLGHFVIAPTLSKNIAALVMATACFNFLFYETMHFTQHVPKKLFLRPFFLQHMREHHLKHHAKEFSTRYNFNVTIPLGDWLFGSKK